MHPAGLQGRTAVRMSSDRDRETMLALFSIALKAQAYLGWHPVQGNYNCLYLDVVATRHMWRHGAGRTAACYCSAYLLQARHHWG